MSTSISEHARQEEGFGDCFAEVKEATPDEYFRRWQAAEKARQDEWREHQADTAAKEREIGLKTELLEIERGINEVWSIQNKALQARVRELDSYETNYHSLQVRLTELENQLIQKFKP